MIRSAAARTRSRSPWRVVPHRPAGRLLDRDALRLGALTQRRLLFVGQSKIIATM